RSATASAARSLRNARGRSIVRVRDHMSAVARTRRAIEAAWHAFVSDGDLHACLRPEIRRSWERVRRHAQVHPGLLAPPSALPREDVLARAAADEAYRVASPLVRDFAARLAPEG